MMLLVIIAVVLGWGTHLVVAQQKVCSSFCSSLGMVQSNPGRSCDDIYQVNKESRGMSGDYWINTTTGVHQVYCDMELECGGHKGGWMRIADFDASRGGDCPTGWTRITTPPNDPANPATDVCRSLTDNAGCHPTSFTVNGARYHKVCGRVRGYQKTTTDAFGGPSSRGKTINDAYVDGVSITLDNPRKHAWTFASGYFDNDVAHTSKCPCAAIPGVVAHSFIRKNYYCESGTTTDPLQESSDTYFTGDPLWDGSGCISANNNCCTNVGLPWFFRQFPTAQQDDIEVRLCVDEAASNEGIAVDQLQLFVQ